MAEVDDDIDDLLDEVENKFLVKKPMAVSTKSKTSKSNKGSNVGNANSSNTSKGNKKSELDDVLNDLDDIMGPEDTKMDIPSSDSTVRKAHGRLGSLGGTGQSRCFPVYIGGISCATGQATAVNQRVCDRLRCTDCDFEVSMFDNFSWHSKTDYLFLRNNMPDYDRLKSKLISKAGYRAYACQCKCRTVREILDLKTDLDLKWVCGKH